MNYTGRVYGTRSTSARPPVAHSPLRRDLSGSSTTVLRSPIATSPIIRVPPPPSSLSVVVVDVSRDDGASSSSAGLVDIGGLTALPTTSSSPEVLSNSREPLASPADMVQSIYDISWAILANPDNWNVGVTLADFQRTGVRRACDLQDLDFDPSCHEPFYVVFQNLLTMLGLRRFYCSINPTFRSPAPEAQVSSPVVLPPPPASHPLPLDPPANPQPPRSRGKTSVILTNGGAPADPLAVPFSYHAPRGVRGKNKPLDAQKPSATGALHTVVHSHARESPAESAQSRKFLALLEDEVGDGDDGDGSDLSYGSSGHRSSEKQPSVKSSASNRHVSDRYARAIKKQEEDAITLQLVLLLMSYCCVPESKTVLRRLFSRSCSSGTWIVPTV